MLDGSIAHPSCYSYEGFLSYSPTFHTRQDCSIVDLSNMAGKKAAGENSKKAAGNAKKGRGSCR